MCILYCCEGRKLDNLWVITSPSLNKEYCIVLYCREILNTLNILSGSFIIYSLKRAISGLIFILLLVFYYSTKITLGVLLALLYKRPVSIDWRNFSFY